MVICVGPPLLRLLARTWKVQVEFYENWEAGRRDGKDPLFAFWHENIPSGAILHRNRQIIVMISQHRDGELIARIVEKLGFRTRRGSTTTRGSQALREMLRDARSKSGLAITPDGPRGPAYSVAPGVLFLAAMSGRPIISVQFASSSCWRAGSWDRMIIPKPFAHVVVAYGAGLEVPRGVLRDSLQLQRYQTLVRERLQQLGIQARQCLEDRSS